MRLTGYAVDGSLIDHEAAIVRQMFERFAVGDSLRSIAAWLTEMGVPTRHGSPRWHPSTVRGALMNPRYAGRAVYQGKENGKLGGWEAIVDDELYVAVQARLNDPRRKTNRYGHDRKHLGSGLYECGVCGRRIYAWSGNRYRCREGCLTRAQAGIDDFVLRVVRERLGRPDLANLITPEASDELRRVGDDVNRLRSRLSQIGDDYDAGHIDGRRYAVASEKVHAELSSAEAAQARLAVGSAAASTLFAPNPIAAFDAAPLMIRRNVIDALCTVKLYPTARGRKTFDPTSVRITPKSWHVHNALPFAAGALGAVPLGRRWQ
ncbi:recombinase family protein [Actinopolymorpha sp. B9G3]|uniref:recombinase family protein n=1 Tax=Actinopolymorpha sp. B9G3 TaxID=3158970 RepID=UPI0032D92050